MRVRKDRENPGEVGLEVTLGVELRSHEAGKCDLRKVAADLPREHWIGKIGEVRQHSAQIGLRRSLGALTVELSNLSNQACDEEGWILSGMLCEEVHDGTWGKPGEVSLDILKDRHGLHLALKVAPDSVW